MNLFIYKILEFFKTTICTNKNQIKRKIIWSMSAVYILLLAILWLIDQYNQFSETFRICFISFIHTAGAAFMAYCLIINKRHQQALYEGLQNDIHRRITAFGGIGLIIGILIVGFCFENIFMWSLISKITILIYHFLQIFYISWKPLIIVPKGTFIPIFGLAHLLVVNICKFFVEWISILYYKEKFDSEKLDRNDFTTMAILYFTCVMSLQNSIWCFYAILRIWETLWKDETRKQQKSLSRYDQKIQVPIFNASLIFTV